MWRSQIELLLIWMTLRISSLNFRKILQRYFFVRATSRSQMMSSSKKAQTTIFLNSMIIRLIDAQSSKSRWRRSVSRQNYWLWVESRRRQSNEDDFSSQFSTTRWRNYTYAAIIVRLFACWKKRCWSLIQSWSMLTFIDIDWDKRFKSIESVSVDARLQRCQQTISSKFCLVKNTRSFWSSFIWSTSLIWSIKRSDQSEHRDARLREYVER